MVGSMKGGEAYRECRVSGVVGNDADSLRFKRGIVKPTPTGLREALNKMGGIS